MADLIPTRESWLSALEARHGKALQDKFSAAAVAVCGLGGLGSNIAVSLARAGVGTLHLIDFDKVDLANLNRQQYTVSQIGMPKTDAMKQTLESIAPYCRVLTHSVRLTEDNIAGILCEGDILCEAFDDPQSKAMLVNAAAELFPEKYIVTSSGMSGLHTGNTIRTRRITDKLYICGDGKSDVAADGTLYAPRVMLCAAHQANQILRIIAGKFDT